MSTLATTFIPPRRAVQVRCARCGGGVEEVTFRGGDEVIGHFLQVHCHGEVEEIRIPHGIVERARGAIELTAFEEIPVLPKTPTLSGETEGLKHDGVGGASFSGVCSCGTVGCHIDDRKPGCPRYEKQT
jgi:hypothetical protein